MDEAVKETWNVPFDCINVVTKAKIKLLKQNCGKPKDEAKYCVIHAIIYTVGLSHNIRRSRVDLCHVFPIMMMKCRSDRNNVDHHDE
ncbi:hypothetical protein L484_000846 [Morus notabilis]|uniref:Uncharacterized protein n=1 Tax=Morus notabilis TaxID=981085 RepID=W9QWV4_9ROSA|nr:hypothetical protein L484_000846 [Morus notabilis]